MASPKTITLVNRGDDEKDLGEWLIDDERYHPILGAACDRATVERAKTEGKKGPYSPEIQIVKSAWDFMKRESPTIQFWLEENNPTGIYVKAS